MTAESLFNTLFNTDQLKYKKQFLKALPSKTERFFSDSFHQYQNKYTVEFVNGKVVSDSTASSCGFAQRKIEQELIYHNAYPLASNLTNAFSISQNIFSNAKRVSLIKKAESAILNKNSALEGLAIKWEAFEKYIYIINSNEFADSKIETLSSISVQVKTKKNEAEFTGKAALSVRNEVKSINYKKIAALIEQAYKDALNSSIAKQLKGGYYDVLLSNKASALLFHEVIGHLVEADYVYNGQSLLKSSINEKIGPAQLTIIDDPEINGPVDYKFDDEGTSAQATLILEKGVLKNFLTDHYHALNMGITKTANARRMLYSSLPLPRMSNTKIIAGSYPFIEMLESMNNGILVTDMGNGYINTQTGDYQFEGANGILIEDRSLKSPLANLKITGNTITTLESIEMVGEDYNISQYHADCEKENQILPVGFSQPTIKISSVKIS